MSLIHEIHKQKPAVRYTLFALSAFIALSAVVFFWLLSFQKQVFMALHSDPAEQQAFLDEQAAQVPNPLASLGGGLKSLAASIGSLIGFDGSKGFDSNGVTDNNQTAHPLPLSE